MYQICKIKSNNFRPCRFLCLIAGNSWLRTSTSWSFAIYDGRVRVDPETHRRKGEVALDRMIKR